MTDRYPPIAAPAAGGGPRPLSPLWRVAALVVIALLLAGTAYCARQGAFVAATEFTAGDRDTAPFIRLLFGTVILGTALLFLNAARALTAWLIERARPATRPLLRRLIAALLVVAAFVLPAVSGVLRAMPR